MNFKKLRAKLANLNSVFAVTSNPNVQCPKCYNTNQHQSIHKYCTFCYERLPQNLVNCVYYMCRKQIDANNETKTCILHTCNVEECDESKLVNRLFCNYHACNADYLCMNQVTDYSRVCKNHQK